MEIDRLCSELAEKARKDGIFRYSTGAIVADTENKVLLIERSAKDSFAGQYEVPGGKVEEGEKIDEAVGRELEEEAGLKIEKILAFIGSFDYVSSKGILTRQFNFQVASIGTDVRLSDEHVNYVWAGREEIRKYKINNELRDILYSFWISEEK